MSRSLSYPAEITAAIAGPPHLYVPLSYEAKPSAEAAAHKVDMAKTIPWNTVSSAIRLFAAAAGEPLPPPPFVDGEAVVIPLPAATVSHPWRAAVLLNLVDFSVYADDEDLRLIKSASLRAQTLSGVTIDAAFSALAAHIEAARNTMSKHLPKGFRIYGDEAGAWPGGSDEFDFDLTLGLSRPLTAPESAQIAGLAEDGEMIVAWMGYATEGTAQAWVDSGKMVYSGKTAATGTTLAWNASRPPTDFTPSLFLVEAALARIGVSIVEWGIDIQDGI